MKWLNQLIRHALRGDAYDLARMGSGGPVQAWHVTPGGRVTEANRPVHNDILYPAADLLSKVLGGQSGYRIGAIYFEFIKNATVFAAPAFTRSDGGYYAALRLNDAATSDFLRVPLDVTPAWSTSDVAKYVSNQVRFYAQTGSNLGERQKADTHGLTFDTGDWAVGGALVATPTNSVVDDVVYSRFYWDVGNRVQKISGHQVGLTWPLQFN